MEKNKFWSVDLLLIDLPLIPPETTSDYQRGKKESVLQAQILANYEAKIGRTKRINFKIV